MRLCQRAAQPAGDVARWDDLNMTHIARSAGLRRAICQQVAVMYGRPPGVDLPRAGGYPYGLS